MPPPRSNSKVRKDLSCKIYILHKHARLGLWEDCKGTRDWKVESLGSGQEEGLARWSR
jgi:hypothetical protein